MMRAFVVDDERLAVKRLVRLLKETGRVQITGWSTDPVDALAALKQAPAEVLFLDIQMPGLSGFEMLSKLESEPLVVFTTAHEQYALKAFEVNSIDYLLKPIEAAKLERALDKLERRAAPDWNQMLKQIAGALGQATGADFASRIASRLGERTQILEVGSITHFFARDKLVYAAAGGKNHVIDQTIGELEQKLDPRQFCRIHRSTLLNVAWVKEVDAWFGGRLLVRLRDLGRTELQVARERAQELKARLGYGDRSR
jgi:two-component system, LytTR family, response regulator